MRNGILTMSDKSFCMDKKIGAARDFLFLTPEFQPDT